MWIYKFAKVNRKISLPSYVNPALIPLLTWFGVKLNERNFSLLNQPLFAQYEIFCRNFCFYC